MRHILALLYALCGVVAAQGQGIAIGADGTAPDTSAILHLKSTSKGLLVPRMTQAQRDNIYQPAPSLLIYQTDADSGFYYRKATGWFPLADNLGNHQLTQNLRTGGRYISSAGDNLGILLSDNGMVRFYGKDADRTSIWETARLDRSGGFIALGDLGFGTIPISGSGSRMMWYPYKSSFRAGGVDADAWDNGNNGFYSAAFGYNTVASGNYSFASGFGSKSTGSSSQALGNTVTASGSSSTAIGSQSVASDFASVAIGWRDTASGEGSVAIGYQNKASGDYSIALGYKATSIVNGSFVAADASVNAVLNATANNQFITRYAGGYRLWSNAATSTGVSLAAGGNSWTSVSDSTKKERFLAADGEVFLHKLQTMRLGSWNYKTQKEPGFRHYGPMAQEFYARFGTDKLGTIGTDTTLATADVDGVLLILVKALEKRTAEQAAVIATLRAENTSLQQRLTASENTTGEWEAFKEVFGSSKETKALLEQVKQLAITRKHALAGK